MCTSVLYHTVHKVLACSKAPHLQCTEHQGTSVICEVFGLVVERDVVPVWCPIVDTLKTDVRVQTLLNHSVQLGVRMRHIPQ